MKIDIVDLEIKSDDRGILIQNQDEEIRSSMKHFFVSFSEPGVIRGQHYHNRKIEWFFIVEGKAEVYLEDITSKEREKIILDSSKPQIIKMPIKVAHAIKNNGDGKMLLLAIVNEPFNESDSDTFPYKVI